MEKTVTCRLFIEALVGKIFILVADPAAVLKNNVSFMCILTGIEIRGMYYARFAIG
jgi:hypothetical protein